MNNWLRLQLQRLREQGVRQRTYAAIRKIFSGSVNPMIAQLHKQPRLRKSALYILRITGLTTRVKDLLATEPAPRVVHLSVRALEIRQELQRILDRLEKTS